MSETTRREAHYESQEDKFWDLFYGDREEFLSLSEPLLTDGEKHISEMQWDDYRKYIRDNYFYEMLEVI